MTFKRLLMLDKYRSSVFLLGPRMTGKSSLLKEYPRHLLIDLLDPRTEFSFKSTPDLLLREVAAVPRGSTVIINPASFIFEKNE